MFNTTNYLFAAYLQTEEGGRHRIQKVERLRPGRAKFHFDIDKVEAEELNLKFRNSCCCEFESARKNTIGLAFD